MEEISPSIEISDDSLNYKHKGTYSKAISMSSSRGETVEFGARLQTLESLRSFVSAQIRNDDQNKKHSATKNSNEFVITKDEFKRIVQTETFSSYIFTLFDPFHSGEIETSSMIQLIQFNIRRERGDQLGQVFDKNANGAWKEIIPQSRLNSLNLYNALNHDWILSQLWTFILRITLKQRRQSCNSNEKERNHKNNIKVNGVTVSEFMTFVTNISLPRSERKISKGELKRLQSNYTNYAYECEDGQKGMTRADFIKNLPGRDEHLKNRIFTIFDQNEDGSLSFDEYTENVRKITNKDDPDESIRFLFRIFDIDESGQISEEEFLKSMRGAVKNNGMKFDEDELKQLTSAFWSETEFDGDKTIGYNEFRDRILKNPGLPKNLSKSIMKCVAPNDERAEPTPKKRLHLVGYKRYFTTTYWKENRLLGGYVLVFIFAQLLMILLKVFQLKDFKNQDGSPNVYYIIARATGFCLDIDNMILLLMVLRWIITKLRCLGMGSYMPLDNNIYLHKVVACFVFLHASIHTLAHLLNFAINVQPDPVHFVYINGITQPYNPPPKCWPNVNGTAQECISSDDKWTYAEWIFTTNPNCFGLIQGAANPTGISMYLILLAIVLASLPCVRRSGRFEIFYWMHRLIWIYWTLLIFHCPDFWKYFIAPFILYLFELTRKNVATRMTDAGNTIIHAGLRLPSKVTNLIICRPEKFNFNPGDWVFVNISEIASQEWHPFTISSAPEQKDFFTLHIRAVGGWTNKLYEYYDIQNKDKGSRTDESLYKRHMRYLKAMSHGIVDITGKDVKTSCELQLDANALKDSHDLNNAWKNNKRLFDCSTPLQIRIDGPYGAPASNIFRASHAVLVSTGIGVTPFSSILQSIMFRYRQSKSKCPKCQHTWTGNMKKMEHLNKVDFFWINRDQVSFEWFIHLLNELELEQAEEGSEMERFLDLHLYMTAMKDFESLEALGLQMALDSAYDMKHKDMITGLKTRTKAGRPNWDDVFLSLKNQNKGPITVFYCGNPYLAKTLRIMCEKYEFQFRKEVF